MSDYSAIIREGNTLVVLAQVYGVDGSLIIQSDLSALTWTLTKHGSDEDDNDGDGDENVVDDDTLVTSSVIFDTPQTFTYPSGRTFAYNFLHRINGDYFVSGGGYKFTALYRFVDIGEFPYTMDIDIDIRDIH